MSYEWLDSYCLSKLGAVKDFKVEWNATRYMIQDKMFAMQGGDKEGKAIITLKLPPPVGSILRQQYEEIIPGYYMNKEHWNSLYLEGNVPDDVVRDMVDQSHGLIFESLTKKVQRELQAKNETEETRQTVVSGQYYKHFKGNLYQIIDVATHSETMETYVVYRALYGEEKLWVRPLELFLSDKEVDGKHIKRFVLVSQD